MSSVFIICETIGCSNNADIIAVYGCLNEHVSDVILCDGHHTTWFDSLPKSICGQCGTHIDVSSMEIKRTVNIKMRAAAGVLNRTEQQAKMKARMRGMRWSSSPYTMHDVTIPSIPYNPIKPFPITKQKLPKEVKKKMTRWEIIADDIKRKRQ